MQRFLDRAFVLGYGYFLRNFPHMFRPDEETLSRSLVAVEDGEILCHVGVFPLTVVAPGVRVSVGGVGAVATAPSARGRGLMSRLLSASIESMREKGYLLSVLWGDRQRYGHFGYELGGLGVRLTLTRRSLEAAGVKPARVEEVDPADPAVLPHVARLHAMQPFRVERPRFDLLLKADGVRLFLSDDGYLLARGNRERFQISEVVSEHGKEAEIVLGSLGDVRGNAVTIDLPAVKEGVTARLAAAAAGWSLEPQGMWRIIDWPSALEALRPQLQMRAQGLTPCEVAIGCRSQEGVEAATIRWDGSALDVTPGRRAGAAYVELDERVLVAQLLGAPLAPSADPAGVEPLGPVARLFPVPLHIPILDHV